MTDLHLLTFDLDGTLVDTADEIAEAANLALESHGIARRPVDEIVRLIGAGTRELMLRLLARCFLAEPPLANRVSADGVVASLDRHYTAIAGLTAQPYPGCHETLQALRTAGVRLACVTNKEMRHAKRVLDATRIGGYFDLLIGGDSLPERKPHPSVLRHVMRVLGESATRSAHVGDSAIDVASARAAGVAAWAVSYGYNAGVPISEARPDQVFTSLKDVAAHVLRPQSRAI